MAIILVVPFEVKEIKKVQFYLMLIKESKKKYF